MMRPGFTKAWARAILFGTAFLLACWTAYARTSPDWGLEWTTSRMILWLSLDHPVLTFAFGIITFSVTRDAFPDTDWRVLLLLCSIYLALGHSLWAMWYQ